MARLVYWDACVFLNLLNQPKGVPNVFRSIWEEGELGKTEIVTSTFTFAEVIRAKCEGPAKPFLEQQEREIDELLSQPWVRLWLLDPRTGLSARRLIRTHPQCKKPADGVHLATALAANVDEMHTTDEDDLIPLNGRVLKANGQALIICLPSVIVPAKPMPDAAPEQGFLGI